MRYDSARNKVLTQDIVLQTHNQLQHALHLAEVRHIRLVNRGCDVEVSRVEGVAEMRDDRHETQIGTGQDKEGAD